LDLRSGSSFNNSGSKTSQLLFWQLLQIVDIGFSNAKKNTKNKAQTVILQSSETLYKTIGLAACNKNRSGHHIVSNAFHIDLSRCW